MERYRFRLPEDLFWCAILGTGSLFALILWASLAVELCESRREVQVESDSEEILQDPCWEELNVNVCGFGDDCEACPAAVYSEGFCVWADDIEAPAHKVLGERCPADCCILCGGPPPACCGDI